MAPSATKTVLVAIGLWSRLATMSEPQRATTAVTVQSIQNTASSMVSACFFPGGGSLETNFNQVCAPDTPTASTKEISQATRPPGCKSVASMMSSTRGHMHIDLIQRQATLQSATSGPRRVQQGQSDKRWE